MDIVQRGSYLIYFDDVRVDPYVVSWNATTGLFANEAGANIVMFRTDAMDKWKAYLVQVRIFGENPFTGKFTMIFEGEIMNRSWSENKADMGKVTYQCKGFYHWLDIPVPMGIENHEQLNPTMRFIYEAQNINIEEVAELIQTNADVLQKDKNIEEIIQNMFEKLTVGYYDVAGSETAFAFAHLKTRFQVMVDVMKEFREAGFLDLFSFTQATQIDSFFVYLNQVLTQLMFEFYQDRDGAFRIKTPSWSDSVLKAHVLDSSIVSNISGMDDWQNEPTRVLAIGGDTQFNSSQQSTTPGESNDVTSIIPMGLYIGDPQEPDEEEYYSQQVQWYRQQFGGNPYDIPAGGATGPAASMGAIGDIEWFDNLSALTVSSHYGPRWGRLHAGTDYPFSSGTSVYNIGTHGKVSKVGHGKTQGNYVHVQQTIGGVMHEFRYYHLTSYSVAAGQNVAPGELLAKSGNTGSSTTGAHLHFEVIVAGNPTDPVPFLSKMKAQMKNVGKPATANASSTGGPSWLSKYKARPWLKHELTAYNAMCPPVTINGRAFKGCTGITASGWDVKNTKIDHRVVAVDRQFIPLGSIVEIEGMGLFNAQDTGGDIKGYRIDILKESYEACMKFGIKFLKVRILRYGPGEKGEIIPAVPIGTVPTTVGGGSASGGFSSAYANVDSPKVVSDGFKLRRPGGPANIDDEKGAAGAVTEKTSKGIKYPIGDLVYKIPKDSQHLSATIKGKPGGLDANLIASVIAASSNWREKYSTSTHIGIMALPKAYANAALAGHNLLAASTAIELSSNFLSECIEHFSGRVSFGLAAYQIGNFVPVEEASKGIDPDNPEDVRSIGTLDFSKARVHLPVATVAFVDHVMSTLAEIKGGDFIEGDPHISFGNKNGADFVEIPDYESTYKPRLSDEEKKFKVNLVRVQQQLIRNDSPALQSTNMTADELIYRFAKYTMQLHRAKTHNVSVSLVTCLPFLRVGLNAWLEPTRKDIMFYITNVSHQGSFQQGCFTTVNGGFVRDPDDYQNIDDSIFVGDRRADSSVYGKQLSAAEMKSLRSELSSMQSKNSVSAASDISVLKGMYSSMNLQDGFTTKWNKEYTFDGIEEQIKKSYTFIPDLIKARKKEIAKIISESEEVFLEKLMFTR